MPGDKKHHTDKWRRCVDEVVGKGHDQSSASAICTTSLQNSGEAIYENAEEHDEMRTLESSEIRELHLLGATGQVRHETLNGRRHLVVPVVALMEGVIHAVNAETPEFVSADVLRRAASSWVGKPGTLGHPKKNGTQCSANEPDVRKSAGLGVLMKSEFAANKKLLQEAWIDEEKAKQLHPAFYKDLEDGKPIEVSVGAFVISRAKEGKFNGKNYKAEWLEVQGDHLAFLPGGRGACSCDMGCGTNRAAMHFVAAESIELLPEELPTMVFSALEGLPLDQRLNAVYAAVNEKYRQDVTTSMATAYTLQVFDDRAIVNVDGETFSVAYAVKDGKAVLGEATKVKQSWVAAAARMAECDACGGTGQVKKDGKQADCPTCDGKGEMRVAAGARHSSGDTRLIQAVHDHAMALGAQCDRANYKLLEEKPSRIRCEGGRWLLYSLDGTKKLGEHRTRADAEEQERAIDAVMARRKAS